VKLRPNKAKKPEHVRQKRAKKTKSMQTVEKEDNGSNVVNPEAKARRYVELTFNFTRKACVFRLTRHPNAPM
jgi:hypothetical protein